MNEDEKNYWITLIPHMNLGQQERLEEILQKEKDKLTELDASFSNKQ